jgi:lipid-binding SYLF domain-containing protein
MMKNTSLKKNLAMLQVIACFMLLFMPTVIRAADAKELDVNVDTALENFKKTVNGAPEFLTASKGVLVFPKVYKAGFWWLGGEYGEGALRIDGKTADFYNMASGSVGILFGAQAKTVVLVFLQEAALKGFQASPGWEAGVNGSVALVDVGAGQTIDSTTFQQPIIGFIFDQKGLMVNLSLEGTKFTKISK